VARTESAHARAAGVGWRVDAAPPPIAGADAHAAIDANNAILTTTVRTLPADRTFLARVDILRCARPKKEGLHVLRQESPRLRVHDVESIVIDQHRLLTHPLCPAFLADPADDACPKRSRERRALESGTRQSAAHTGYVRHGNAKSGRAAYERAYSTFASRTSCSNRMYSQPMSSSYHLALNFADFGSAWWLL